MAQPQNPLPVPMRSCFLFFLVLFISPQLYGQVAVCQRTTTPLTSNAVGHASGQEAPAGFEVFGHYAATRLRGSSRPAQAPFLLRWRGTEPLTVLISSVRYHPIEDSSLVLCDSREYWPLHGSTQPVSPKGTGGNRSCNQSLESVVLNNQYPRAVPAVAV